MGLLCIYCLGCSSSFGNMTHFRSRCCAIVCDPAISACALRMLTLPQHSLFQQHRPCVLHSFRSTSASVPVPASVTHCTLADEGGDGIDESLVESGIRVATQPMFSSSLCLAVVYCLLA